MLTGIKKYILANVESVQNAENGDRAKRVTGAKVLAKTVELVGIQTAQFGQIQGFTLSFSVEIPRIMYTSEKYLYFDGQLYEVKTIGKARNASDMLLHVQKLNDPEIKKAVEVWQNENLRRK